MQKDLNEKEHKDLYILPSLFPSIPARCQVCCEPSALARLECLSGYPWGPGVCLGLAQVQSVLFASKPKQAFPAQDLFWLPFRIKPQHQLNLYCVKMDEG